MESAPGRARAVAGGEHTLYHAKDGRVYSFGSCGLGWNRLREMKEGFFRAISAFEKAETIASGYYHNLAVTAGGDLYSWGCGTFPDGQGEGSKPALGQGLDAEDKGAFPAQVTSEVADVAAGAYHSVALTKAGEVLTFGAGQLGQLGRSMPEGETDASGLPIDATPRPVEGLPGGESFHIGAGFYNTFVACRKSGKLYCSGENQNTQCGFQDGFGTY